MNVFSPHVGYTEYMFMYSGKVLHINTLQYNIIYTGIQFFGLRRKSKLSMSMYFQSKFYTVVYSGIYSTS